MSLDELSVNFWMSSCNDDKKTARRGEDTRERRGEKGSGQGPERTGDGMRGKDRTGQDRKNNSEQRRRVKERGGGEEQVKLVLT
eukprot:763490-Hanusia_phi.AAC.2